jgi:hypothetical protein
MKSRTLLTPSVAVVVGVMMQTEEVCRLTYGAQYLEDVSYLYSFHFCLYYRDVGDIGKAEAKSNNYISERHW